MSNREFMFRSSHKCNGRTYLIPSKQSHLDAEPWRNQVECGDKAFWKLLKFSSLLLLTTFLPGKNSIWVSESGANKGSLKLLQLIHSLYQHCERQPVFAPSLLVCSAARHEKKEILFIYVRRQRPELHFYLNNSSELFPPPRFTFHIFTFIEKVSSVFTRNLWAETLIFHESFAQPKLPRSRRENFLLISKRLKGCYFHRCLHKAEEEE